MPDILYLLSTAVCFAAALLYVMACDRLKGRRSVD
jgi:hypothetical protein